MNEIGALILFHFIATLILFFLVNFLGERTRFRGYTNLEDILERGQLGYNLLFRILSPAIFISILSVFLYIFDFESFIKGIWLIAIWYSILRLLVTIFIGRFRLINKTVYFFTHLSAIGLSYLFYVIALSKGIDFILPDNANFRTEIWLVFLIYLYQLLNQSSEIDYQKKESQKNKIIKKDYKKLKKKYKEFLDQRFLEDNFLETAFFSIMIAENFNRGPFKRFLERLFFFTGLIKSTGIMQVCAKKFLSDEESISLAKDIIFEAYTKESELGYFHNSDLLEKIVRVYNPDERYIQLVHQIFYELDSSLLYKQKQEAPIPKGNLENGMATILEDDLTLDGLIKITELISSELKKIKTTKEDIDKNTP